MEALKDIVDAVVTGNVAGAKEAVRRALDDGVTPMDIIDKGMVAGLDIMGEQFAAGEMFLPEMILASIAAREGLAIATADMKEGQYKPKATMVMGTVKGDLHDIGKNLVVTILRSRGFEVIDLGTDVHEEQFVNAIREHKPDMLGMSCLVTTTMIAMRDVVDAVTEAGLRDTVKVIVGGCPVTQDFATQIGADYYSRDAGSTATLLEKVFAETKS